jgi:hypothetical protein
MAGDVAPLFRWRDALLGEHGPSSTCRLVLLTLSLDADGDGARCFPSTRRLAERTGLSRRAVEKHLRDAEGQWIERSERGGGQGWRRMTYTLRIPPDVGNEGIHVDGERGEPASPPPRANVGNEGIHVEGERGEPDDRTWGTSRPNVGNDVPLTLSKTTPRDVVAARDGVGDVDGFAELDELFPEAVAVLETLTHPGGAVATMATLRTSFLHPDGGGLPDPSVRGLPLDARRELVARALIQMRDQGVDRWKVPVLAAFIRPLRESKADGSTDEAERTEAELARIQAKHAERADLARLQAEGQQILEAGPGTADTDAVVARTAAALGRPSARRAGDAA